MYISWESFSVYEYRNTNQTRQTTTTTLRGRCEVVWIQCRGQVEESKPLMWFHGKDPERVSVVVRDLKQRYPVAPC